MSYFNENMSSKEAERALYRIADTAPKEEFAKAKKEFFEVIPVISKRESEAFRKAGANMFTNEAL